MRAARTRIVNATVPTTPIASLDGPDASHGVPHMFDCAVEVLEEARDIGLDTQIQTTVTAGYAAARELVLMP